MNKVKIIGLIPARMGSSRFPGKPLVKILNYPMIYWVYQQAIKVNGLDEIYVTTQDMEIKSACDFYNIPCRIGKYDDINTAADLLSHDAELLDGDIYINIQGDEPLVNPKAIEQIINAMLNDESLYYVGLKSKINTKEEFMDPNVVKAIVDENNDALTFSRSPIPYNFNNNYAFRVMGIYGYRSEFLKKFHKYSRSKLEILENGVEMLRMIQNGYKVHLVDTNYTSIGVDLPEHIKKVEQILISK